MTAVREWWCTIAHAAFHQLLGHSFARDCYRMQCEKCKRTWYAPYAGPR